MDKLTLKVEKRALLGRKVKSLRKEGLVPGNVFGKKVKSESVQVKLTDFEKVYKAVGETGLLDLQIGGDKKPVLVHNVQIDPLTDAVLHVDYLQVNLKEKVTAKIPVELVGESPAEKQSIGTVVQYLDEVEVEAFPTDLPEKFEIDISNLTDVDQTFYLKDLKVDKNKVELKEDLEKIIAKVEPPKEEKVEVPVTEAVVSEGEVVEAGKAESIQSTEEESKVEKETPQS